MATGFKGTRNENGRPIGSKNKKTNEIREQFQSLINDNLEQMDKDLKALEPKDRIKAIIDLAKFCVPTLKAIDYTDNNTDKERISPIVIQFIDTDGTRDLQL
jgi:hypothetical protein